VLTYRLCRAAFTALDGEGARRYGGRWNSVGGAIVYTSATVSLAALEYLVRVDVTDAPSDLVALTIELPDDISITRVHERDLPPRWHEYVDVESCRVLGDRWLAEASSAILAVPSAAVTSEWNYLVNLAHMDAAAMQLIAQHPFRFDPRLVR